MNISIIICTYNRCDSLKSTLDSICMADIPSDSPFEVIVIDNNSKDGTRQVVEQFEISSSLKIRYVLEEKQGLSFARNRGITEASGDILVFTDDDVIVDGSWICRIEETFKDIEVSCAGGRIYPQWQKTCPRWLKKDLHGHLALLDLGNKRIKMTEPRLWGANLIFRASMFDKYGRFDTSLGRTASKLYGNEEIKMIKTLIDNAEGVYYIPEIIVHHCIGENRMEKSYFRKWFIDAGELDGIQFGVYPYRNLLGVPYYYVKFSMIAFWQYFICIFKRCDNAFLNELSFLRTIGFMKGRMKVHKFSKTQQEVT